MAVFSFAKVAPLFFFVSSERSGAVLLISSFAPNFPFATDSAITLRAPEYLTVSAVFVFVYGTSCFLSYDGVGFRVVMCSGFGSF